MSQTPDSTPQEPSTSWTLLARAHDPAAAPEARDRARQELVCRYQGVARRYLARALRQPSDHPEAVDDLLQEFSLKVMGGALRTVSAARGRLRPYLQAVLCNLVHDYRRDRGRQPEALGGRDVEAAQFKEVWREGLMDKAFAALQAFEQKTGQVLYSVLRLKSDRRDWGAAEIAEEFGRRFGRRVTDGWVRKRLHLARRRLWELLVLEVRRTLPQPATDQDAQEELAELDLLRYRPRPDDRPPP